MPNGISCAFFAGRNLIMGKSEKNVFKEGIGCAQTVRAAEKVVQSGTVAAKVTEPLKTACSAGARIAEKIVYPLIITSGIYNTVTSTDKVRTGASQASGIGTMFAFEQLAEKTLKNIDKKVASSASFNNNKALRIAWYVAKGLAFVSASLTGYNIGSAGGGKIVDSIRAKKEEKQAAENNIFNDIMLQ